MAHMYSSVCEDIYNSICDVHNLVCDLPWEKAMAPLSSTVAQKIPWMEEPGRLQSMGSLRVGHDWATFTFHFHAWEKEMATHSSVLAWRIPWTEKPGRLQSMGLHRVGHHWSGLVVVVIYPSMNMWKFTKCGEQRAEVQAYSFHYVVFMCLIQYTTFWSLSGFLFHL